MRNYYRRISILTIVLLIGVVSCRTDQYDSDRTIERLEKALIHDIRTLGEDHPKVATRWNNLGTAWDAKGDYDKAIEFYEKALFSFQMSLGNDHQYTKTVKSALDSLKEELEKGKPTVANK